MNAEGVGPTFSAEWLQATATGLVFLVIALWIVLAQGSLWRGMIWRSAAAAVQATAVALEGQVRPRWCGWRVEAAAVDVDYFGGLRGLRTRVTVYGNKSAHLDEKPGLLSSAEVGAMIAAVRRHCS